MSLKNRKLNEFALKISYEVIEVKILTSQPIIIYSKEYERVNFGYDHPFNKERFSRTYNYFKLRFRDLKVIEPSKISEDLLEIVHSKRYIEEIKKMSELGSGFLHLDTPAFKGMFEWGLLCCGGSLEAARLALSKKTAVFNPCGGYHHAHREYGWGFCIFNDVAFAALYFHRKGYRVAVLDWDAHAGEGTMDILYNEPILKISVHESPYYLFPGDGYQDQFGAGEGYGYTINIPLEPYSSDRELIFVLDEIAIPALKAFDPDIIILQSGGDGFVTDPLTHLSYTIYGYKEAAMRVKSLNKPVAVLGGGGYDLDVLPVIWSVVYGVLIGRFKDVEADYNKLLKLKAKEEKAWGSTKKLVNWLKKKHPFIKKIAES